MKRTTLCIIFTLIIINENFAQNKNQLSLRLSLNQVELGFQHTFCSPKLWGEAFIGTGNYDINSQFDDFLAGMRLGINAFSNKKNIIGICTSLGIYVPNNDYYNATTATLGANIQYAKYIGKNNRHSILVSIGYQYGKRQYKQTYTSNLIRVATTEYFKIYPLYFSVGYGFQF